MSAPTATGRCVCGAVRYATSGSLRNVIVCHCVECRRYHGTSGAYSAAQSTELAIDDPEGALRWFPGPESVTHGERGFCGRCGSSMFWRAPGVTTVSIAAGTLDGTTGLHIIQHIWDEQRADWELEDDVPRLPRGS